MTTSFSERLITAMNREGLKQADLAKLLGLSRAAVSRWMIEYPNLSSKKLAELSGYLNVSINWLLLGTHTLEKPVLFEPSCLERQILLVLNDLDEELKEHFIQMAMPLAHKRSATLKKPRLKSDRIIHGQKLPIVIINMDGLIVYANKHYNDYFGATAQGISLVKHSAYEVLPEFFHGTARLDMLRTQMSGHTSNFKCTGKRIDSGGELAFTIFARTIETAEQSAIFAVLFPEI